ncbi:MAG: ATP-binding protein [Solobacterium sp.]|nr:ATP-binding protein [Solobacterium sp.]
MTQQDKHHPEHSILLSTIFRRLIIANFIQNVTMSITGSIDTALIGRSLGATGLSALQLSVPIFFIFSIVSQTFGSGASIVLTRQLAGGERDKAIQTFSTVCALTVCIGIVFAAIGLFFPGIVVNLMAGSLADPVVKAGVTAYLKPILLAAVIVMLYDVFVAVIIMEGGEKRMMRAVAIIIAMDIIGDLTAIKLNAGMLGFGLSTSIAYVLAFLSLLGHFRSKQSMLRIETKIKMPYLVKGVILAGMPLGIRFLCVFLRPLFVNRMMLEYGTLSALAALSVQDAIHYFPQAMCSGIAATALLMAGMLFMEQDADGLANERRDILRWSFIGCTVFAALTGFCLPVLIRIFTTDPEIYSLALTALRWYLICVPFAAVNYATASYLLGIGKTTLSSLHIVLDHFAFPVLWSRLLGAMFHETGIYAAFAASEICMTLFAGIVLAGWLIYRKSHAPKEAKDTNIYELRKHVTSAEEANQASQEVYAFYKFQGIDPRKVYHLSLCMEELAVNSIEHGFNDGRKHHLEVRTAVSDEWLILRLRDDCRRFNLKERYEMLNPKDVESHIGLRLIFASADEISYSSAMYMNNVCIKIRLKDKPAAA